MGKFQTHNVENKKHLEEGNSLRNFVGIMNVYIYTKFRNVDNNLKCIKYLK